MSLFNQIQDNSVTVLRLKDTDDEMIDNITKLIDTIKQNTSIETIHFEGEYLGCLRCDFRNELLEAAGELPNLQVVTMGFSPLHISGITKMLINAKKLRVLKLDSMVIQGVEREMQACETALYSHQALKEFDMNDCGAAVQGLSVESLELAGKKVSAAATSGNPSIRNETSARVA